MDPNFRNRDYSLSFCTVCMNRLHHLKETLPKNISDNSDEPDIEFVVLDYHSGDGLGEWMKENMQDQISRGLVSYYRTDEREDFDRAHSRNMAFRLARGEILCNIDADNFTGRGFAAYLKRQFRENDDIFLCAGDATSQAANSNVLGRISLLKKDFILTEGFDEFMKNYGFEDQDLINRLEAAGRRKQIISDPSFLRSISHQVDERIENEFLLKNLRSLLVNYINPSSSELIFLLKNNQVIRGTLINNYTVNSDKKEFALKYTKPAYEFSLLHDEVLRQEFSATGQDFLIYDKGEKEMFRYNRLLKCYDLIRPGGTRPFYRITELPLIREAVFFFSQITNRIRMASNLHKRAVAVNNANYGRGTAYKNFNLAHPVVLETLS